MDLSLLIEWLHGWRLPSLLSWSAVGWLVWAKRLTECLADYWLVRGCRIKKSTCLYWLTDCMAGGFLPCLAGRRLVDWFGQRDWQNVWLTIGWWETADSKIDLSLLIDWLHGWRLPSLLSWSAVGWLVWAKRLTECLADYWLVGGCRIKKSTCLYWLTDCMAGGFLPCLAGRRLVDWFGQRDWQNVWLTIGWWEGVD